MGTKYSNQAISGYNASPPSDDGSTASTNQLSWAKHLSKIGNPLKTFSEAINSTILTALDTSCRVITSSDPTVAGDNLRTIQIGSTTTVAITVSLMDAVTATNGYIVTVSNQSSISHTIGKVTASDTINSSTNSVSILPLQSITFKVNAAANGYNIVSDSEASAFKVGTFTRVMSVASGNVSYTGVGFKPKAIIFWSRVGNGAVQCSSKGFDDGTTRMQLFDYTTTGDDSNFAQTANAIYVFDDAGTTNTNSATVASFDADGFTLAWVKGNTPTSTMNCGYLALR